jgi:hypothetical protein
MAWPSAWDSEKGGSMKRASKFLSLTGSVIILLAVAVRADFTAPVKNLSNTANDSLFPKVCTVTGTDDVYVCWIETDGANDYLSFSKSTDGGVTWRTPDQLQVSGQIRSPLLGGMDNYYCLAMTVAPPYIHVVFQWRLTESDDFEIIYARSSDLGENILNWAFAQLTDNSAASRFPDVVASGTYVHVVYQDSWPGNDEVFYKRITDYGAGSVDQTRRLTFSSSPSSHPRIAVTQGGEGINIVYQDLGSTAQDLFFKHITDSGAGLYDTRQLTSGAFFNGLPEIAASTGNDQYIYIVYQSLWPGNREIMYKRLDNHGAAPFNTYTARLTYSTTPSLSNSVAFDGTSTDVCVSYHDSWPGNYDVMFKKLPSYGGGGFTSQRVSWGGGASGQSTVGAAGGSAWVAWSDDSSGNYEIYIKKGS